MIKISNLFLNGIKLKYICSIIVYLDRPVAATCTLKKI